MSPGLITWRYLKNPNAVSMKNILDLFSLIVLTVISITSFSQKENNDRGGHDIDPETKKEVMKTLDAFMTAFNARDRKATEATYHFPHYRLASGKMMVLDSAGSRQDTSRAVAPGLKKIGWHHSAWNHRNIVQASSEKVHVDTQYSRYREDGSLIANYESLYILTKENGRWGIKFRSSYAD